MFSGNSELHQSKTSCHTPGFMISVVVSMSSGIKHIFQKKLDAAPINFGFYRSKYNEAWNI